MANITSSYAKFYHASHSETKEMVREMGFPAPNFLLSNSDQQLPAPCRLKSPLPLPPTRVDVFEPRQPRLILLLLTEGRTAFVGIGSSAFPEAACSALARCSISCVLLVGFQLRCKELVRLDQTHIALSWSVNRFLPSLANFSTSFMA
jgi:hypothetical protein